MTQEFGWNIMFQGFDDEYVIAWFHFHADALEYMKFLERTRGTAFEFYSMEKE